MTVFARPGSADALMAYESRYGNFIGGEWVAPRRRRVLRESDAGDRADLLRDAPLRMRRTSTRRSTPPTVRRRMGQDRGRRARQHPQQDRRPHRSQPRIARAGRSLGQRQADPRDAGNADMPLAVDHFRYFAGAIRAQEGSLCQIDDDTVAYHFHEPLGVVGQIIPWNFPILMATWKLAPGAGRGQSPSSSNQPSRPRRRSCT